MRDDQHLAATVNIETHHEESDVNVRALIWFIVIFIVFAILTNVAIWGLFRFFVVLERGNTRAPMTALAMPRDANIPSVPRLQPFPGRDPASGQILPPTASTPVKDMNEMHAAEDAALNGPPQWVDQQPGTVRIPIARAMALIVQRGLPVSGRASAPGPDTTSSAGAAGAPPASTPGGDSNAAPIPPVAPSQQPGPTPGGGHR
jgi:hypothetical protein